MRCLLPMLMGRLMHSLMGHLNGSLHCRLVRRTQPMIRQHLMIRQQMTG